MENLKKILEITSGEAARNMRGLRLYNALKARKKRLEYIVELLKDKNVKMPAKGLCRVYDTYDDMMKEFDYNATRFENISKFDNQLMNVKLWLTRLVMNNTIDHQSDVERLCRPYFKEWPAMRLHLVSGIEPPRGQSDVWSRYLSKVTYQARYDEYKQRLDAELYEASKNGWYVIFDTLTIDPLIEEKFFKDENAIRDHVRKIGRLVNKACGRKARDSYTDVFKFFGVPEYGKEKGRLHFHLLYLCKEMPYGSVDPNIGRKVRNLREIRALKIWKYGFNAPIAVRYSGDAFTKSGWLWPVDKKGKPLDSKPVTAVGRYVAKYVTKDAKDRKRWIRNNPNKKATFRIRMTRNFGKVLNLSMLSQAVLLELSCLHDSVTKNAKLLRKSARKTLSMSLAKMSIKNYLDQKPKTTGLLELLRGLTLKKHGYNRRSSIVSLTYPIKRMDISDECRQFIERYERAYISRVSVGAL